ncbi:DNA mismatch repair protein MutT [Spirochaetia bacterium]|nr:DNA mismatch repair protein MutT [Spirochaetia bacterium]
MDNNNLIWKEESRKDVFNCRVFTIQERNCRSPEGVVQPFTVMNAADWAIVIPVLETDRGREFVMVRQWRHGSQEISIEFPGGVFEPGETGAEAAAREMREETAWIAGTITPLGVMSPNPAIMSNRVHFFLAEDLTSAGGQDLDDDEYVEVRPIPADEVIRNMGKPPYIHSLMASALMLYLRRTS